MIDKERPIDILAVGGIDMDLVLTVSRLPGHDEKEMGELVGHLPGGPAANFACAASRLGLNVASMSQVGDDASGRAIIEDFQQHGVDTSWMEVREGEATPFTVILLDPTGEKAIIVVPTFTPVYDPAMVTRALSESHYMYIMPGDEQQFAALAQTARQQGAEVMIDIEPTVCDDRDKLTRLLAHTDIASFNQFGFTAAAGREPSQEAARELLAYGPHTIIVTMGRCGSLVVTREDAARHPGYAVEVADTTGAGDTFHAAFLAATRHGDGLHERLRFANATAALSVMALGPRGHLPRQEEVAQFLEEHE